MNLDARQASCTSGRRPLAVRRLAVRVNAVASGNGIEAQYFRLKE